MPVLELAFGSDRPHPYPLRPGRMLVGRTVDCDILLDDDTVGVRHCAIIGDGHTFRIMNLSEAGTEVNDTLLAPGEEAPLPLRSTVRIGRYRGQLVSPDQLRSGRCTSTLRMFRHTAHERILEASADGVVSIRAELVVVDGPLADQRFPLEAPRIVIGGPDADIRLPMPPALARHRAAELRVEAGRATIEPGAIPVRVGGRLIDGPLALHPTDIVTLGEHRFLIATSGHRARPSCDHDRFGRLYGTTPDMRRVIGILEHVASSPITVLLLGPTGTGKTAAAEALHDHSGRNGAFIKINMSAIPPTLFESTLVGHERGAFTGAVDRRPGAFQEARNGTLFLDEIGEIDLSLQVKLLHLLESGTIARVGSHHVEKVNVRLVAATNRDLAAMVAAGTFREDLFYRLVPCSVVLPALAERMVDLRTIATEMLEEQGSFVLTDRAWARLLAHPWPGNLRELLNVLQTATTLCEGSTIDEADLLFPSLGLRRASVRATALDAVTILQAHETHRTRKATAAALGVSETALNRRIARLGLALPSGRG